MVGRRSPPWEAEKERALMFSQSTEGLGAGHGSASDISSPSSSWLCCLVISDGGGLLMCVLLSGWKAADFTKGSGYGEPKLKFVDSVPRLDIPE
jgi:hypothetical protein